MRKSRTNLCRQITGLFGKVINVATQVFSSLARPTLLQQGSLILMALPMVSGQETEINNNFTNTNINDTSVPEWIAEDSNMQLSAALSIFVQFFTIVAIYCGCCCTEPRNVTVRNRPLLAIPLLEEETEQYLEQGHAFTN